MSHLMLKVDEASLAGTLDTPTQSPNLPQSHINPHHVSDFLTANFLNFMLTTPPKWISHPSCPPKYPNPRPLLPVPPTPPAPLPTKHKQTNTSNAPKSKLPVYPPTLPTKKPPAPHAKPSSLKSANSKTKKPTARKSARRRRRRGLGGRGWGYRIYRLR